MTVARSMASVIERRMLVNYQVDGDALRRFLPEPFRPQLVNGVGVAGICLIRIGKLRPVGTPAWFGITTENAAHRVAVEWDDGTGVRRGVYIPRRDTDSRLTAMVGGRLFPGEHHRADFRVHENDGRYEVAFTSHDGTARVAVAAKVATDLPTASVFGSMTEATAFFRDAPLGYSVTHIPGRYDGVEIGCESWNMTPLDLEHVESSFFDDTTLFPTGTVQLDSAIVMRDITATWVRLPAPRLGTACA